MRITAKLFASLGAFLPSGAAMNRVELDVSDSATPLQVIRQLNVPLEQCHLVLVNGVYVEPAERSRRELEPGDTLAIWPPVAGG